jgi:HD-like signal output (HDOD) protein/GGDEF domain-containing protein
MIDRTNLSGCLNQIVERSRQLYSLPAVAVEVIKLTENEQIGLRALKECIENDPALCAKILRVVNSSLFGLSRRISDLNQAVTLLGARPLKLLVLGFSLPGDLYRDMARGVLEYYWRGALTKAVGAREIAGGIWNLPGDEPFIAALLQDIGILVLVQDVGEPYVQLFQRVMESRGELASLEIATFGFDHTVLSARLLDHWQFPDKLVRAVGLPHDVERLLGLPREEQALPQILHLAELLCQLLARERTEILPELLEVAERYRPLAPRQLESIVASLQEKVQQLADVMSLKMPEGSSYEQLLDQAQERLAQIVQSASCAPADQAPVDESLSRATRRLATAVESFYGTRAGRTTSGVATAPEGDAGASTVPWSELALSTWPTVTINDSSTATLEDLGLEGRVAASVAFCRQSRHPISLLMVALDRYDELVMTRGVDSVQSLVRRLQSAAEKLSHPEGACLLIGEGQLALILENCDRSQAVETGRQLVRAVRQFAQGRADLSGAAVSISAGVATLALPPKNFQTRELIDAASRCLFAAQTSGGDVLKSIDIF